MNARQKLFKCRTCGKGYGKMLGEDMVNHVRLCMGLEVPAKPEETSVVIIVHGDSDYGYDDANTYAGEWYETADLAITARGYNRWVDVDDLRSGVDCVGEMEQSYAWYPRISALNDSGVQLG